MTFEDLLNKLLRMRLEKPNLLKRELLLYDGRKLTTSGIGGVLIIGEYWEIPCLTIKFNPDKQKEKFIDITYFGEPNV